MTRMEIELTDEQQSALTALARETGRSEQELLREAVDHLIDENDRVDWRGTLAKLEGIWAQREDLPDLRELRREMDRGLWQRE